MWVEGDGSKQTPWDEEASVAGLCSSGALKKEVRSVLWRKVCHTLHMPFGWSQAGAKAAGPEQGRSFWSFLGCPWAYFYCHD